MKNIAGVTHSEAPIRYRDEYESDTLGILGWQPSQAMVPAEIMSYPPDGLNELRARIKSHFPVWTFTSQQVKVVSSKPIQVHISRGEELFFAENETLRIYATGETMEEVIQDFIEQVIHHYHHYRRTPWERVTGEAAKLKKLYEEIFTEVNLP
ncbi:MAG: hypothetical protein HY731_04485 [Candidatus Tectomicrobia bacterium]|nr:hypothetical protein [Candidatus Tectomicrobia bacterium]